MPDTQTISVAAQLADALSRPGQLSPLPQVAMAAMRLADDPNAVAGDLERIISSDAALSARVLKIANSAFYGARTEVASLDAALQRLGFGAIKNIAIAASLTRNFRALRPVGSFDPLSLWTHSVAVGTAARLIAARTGFPDAGEAFLAGLLHDIGVIVELQLSHESFVKTVNLADADAALSFRQAEMQLYGATHEDYGEAMAIAWHFPAQLGQVCGYHHRPHMASKAARRLTTIVHIADVLAAESGLGYSRTVETLAVGNDVAESIGRSRGSLDEIRGELSQHVSDALPVLS